MGQEDVLDWLVQDEEEALQAQYEAVAAGGDVVIDEGFDDERVEMHLRCLRHHQDKRDAIDKQYRLELQKMEQKFMDATQTLDGSIRFHTENLVAFGKALGETFKGLNGNVKKTAGRGSVLCETEEDQKKFYAWCEETGNLDTLTRLEPEKRLPQKKEIAKHCKASGGEEPPGINYNIGDDSYKVEFK